MRRAGLAALAAMLVLTGCSSARESRLNPFNWFGSSAPEEVSLAPRGGYDTETDRRPVVQQVTQLRVDRTPGGAIIHAVGLPPTQGYWETDLVPTATGINGRPVAERGALTFQFRVVPPPTREPQGRASSREVIATVFLTDQELNGVRTITVQGQTNQRSARR